MATMDPLVRYGREPSSVNGAPERFVRTTHNVRGLDPAMVSSVLSSFAEMVGNGDIGTDLLAGKAYILGMQCLQAMKLCAGRNGDLQRKEMEIHTSLAQLARHLFYATRQEQYAHYWYEHAVAAGDGARPRRPLIEALVEGYHAHYQSALKQASSDPPGAAKDFLIAAERIGLLAQHEPPTYEGLHGLLSLQLECYRRGLRYSSVPEEKALVSLLQYARKYPDLRPAVTEVLPYCPAAVRQRWKRGERQNQAQQRQLRQDTLQGLLRRERTKRERRARVKVRHWIQQNVWGS